MRARARAQRDCTSTSTWKSACTAARRGGRIGPGPTSTTRLGLALAACTSNPPGPQSPELEAPLAEARDDLTRRLVRPQLCTPVDNAATTVTSARSMGSHGTLMEVVCFGEISFEELKGLKRGGPVVRTTPYAVCSCPGPSGSWVAVVPIRLRPQRCPNRYDRLGTPRRPAADSRARMPPTHMPSENTSKSRCSPNVVGFPPKDNERRVEGDHDGATDCTSFLRCAA